MIARVVLVVSLVVLALAIDHLNKSPDPVGVAHSATKAVFHSAHSALDAMKSAIDVAFRVANALLIESEAYCTRRVLPSQPKTQFEQQ